MIDEYHQCEGEWLFTAGYGSIEALAMVHPEIATVFRDDPELIELDYRMPNGRWYRFVKEEAHDTDGEAGSDRSERQSGDESPSGTDQGTDAKRRRRTRRSR